jgi:hypothetical protein
LQIKKTFLIFEYRKKVTKIKLIVMETNNTVFLPNKECLIGRAKVNKVGKLHKGKRIVKVQQIRENIEGQFLYLANKDKKRIEQRNARAEKRALRK